MIAMQTQENSRYERRPADPSRQGFLDRFPGIAHEELVRLFTATWRAFLEIAHEHDFAMMQLELEPDNDSYRIFEHMAREEVTHAEARMNRLIVALRDKAIETDDDLVAIVTFECFIGSLAPRNPGFLKALHRRFEERFHDEVFYDADPPAAPEVSERKEDLPPAHPRVWGPKILG